MISPRFLRRFSLTLSGLTAFVGLAAVSHVWAGCYVQSYDNAASMGCTAGDVLSQGPCHLGNCAPPGAGVNYCGDKILSNTVRIGVSLVDEPGQMNGTIHAEKLDGPIVFDIGRFVSGAQFDEMITISKSRFSQAGLTILEADGVRAELVSQNDGEPDAFALRVRGVCPKERGEFECNVEVEAENYMWEKATLSIRGIVDDRWRVPSDIFMGLIPKDSSQTKIIRIQDRFPALARVKDLPSVEPGDGSVVATCRFREDGEIWYLITGC